MYKGITRKEHSNKSFVLGKKPMCKNCAHYVEYWSWMGAFRYCNADGHFVKHARCRCINKQFEKYNPEL